MTPHPSDCRCPVCYAPYLVEKLEPTVKIIKEGNLEKINKYIDFVCYVCDCEFQVKQDKCIKAEQYNEAIYQFTCPTCTNLCSVTR